MSGFHVLDNWIEEVGGKKQEWFTYICGPGEQQTVKKKEFLAAIRFAKKHGELGNHKAAVVPMAGAK